MTEGLPIVLVPGLLCTPRLYAEQMPHLWALGPVTVADHRRDDSMDGIVRRLLAQAPERFALVGLSMGGYIAHALMRAEPQRVVKLVLLDTGARADTPEQAERRKTHIGLAQSGRFDEVLEMLHPAFVHKNRRTDTALKKIVLDMAAVTGPDAFVRQLKAIMTRPDSRPHLPDYRCPTLILVGDGDELTPPSLAEEMAGLIAGSRLQTIVDCGHLSTLEQPDAVTRALVDFIKA